MSDLRAAVVSYPTDPKLAGLVSGLQNTSSAFARLWSRAELVPHQSDVMTIHHKLVGSLALDCDVLHLPGSDARLVTYTARPGSEDESKLSLVFTFGQQKFDRI